MSRGKINNSYLEIKQELRKAFINELQEKNVLDCFCGKSEIWRDIKTNSYIGIDKEKTNDINLHGDNKKWLKIIDLKQFNIIDLDSYGIPFKQLQIIFNNRTLQTGTLIFFTFIQSVFGKMPAALLKLYGYSKEMIKKIPTLFNRKGFEIFKWYLSTQGIKKIQYLKIDNKIYGMFRVDKERKND
jgi:hypothetical protein